MAFQASFAQTILVFLSPVFIVITPIVFLFVSSKLCLAMMAALGCQEVGSVWAFTLFTLLGMLSFVVFNVLANLGAKPKTLINEFYLDYACDCDKTWRIESYYNLERPCPRCQKNVKSFSRTPYHGQERVFGRFKCSTCGRQWFSHASWANMSQNCLNCQSQVFPYQQVSLVLVCLVCVVFHIDIRYFWKPNSRNPGRRCPTSRPPPPMTPTTSHRYITRSTAANNARAWAPIVRVFGPRSASRLSTDQIISCHDLLQ